MELDNSGKVVQYVDKRYDMELFLCQIYLQNLGILLSSFCTKGGRELTASQSKKSHPWCWMVGGWTRSQLSSAAFWNSLLCTPMMMPSSKNKIQMVWRLVWRQAFSYWVQIDGFIDRFLIQKAIVVLNLLKLLHQLQLYLSYVLSFHLQYLSFLLSAIKQSSVSVL